MRENLLKIAGVCAAPSEPSVTVQVARAAGPLLAPFAILLCAPRWELVATAACWSALVLPGVLAINRWFSDDHPLGSAAARPAVASVIGLLSFGLISWIGCLVHARLTTILAVYAAAYVVGVGLLARSLLKGARPGGAGRTAAEDPTSGFRWSRWAAAGVVLGIGCLLAGVAWSAQEARPEGPVHDFFSTRPHWWRGTMLATAGALLSAGMIVWSNRRSTDETDSGRDTPAKRATKKSTAPSPALTRSFVFGLLWLAPLVLTGYVMKASYALPQKDFPRPAWNSDDVTYVAEAVDYRFGLPLGRFEPTLGAEIPMSPVNLSPLIAPLVASISRVTGVEPAALHHSVMCPLVVLLGASALAGALQVVFRGHRWAVPLGLTAVLMLICKSWEYERSMVEFTVWRAMQSKSVHLWLTQPLQLATVVLLACRPDARHVLIAVAVAIVGHLSHPFSTILGAVWCAVALAYATVAHTTWRIVGPSRHGHPARESMGWKPMPRSAVTGLLVLLLGYAALGAAYKLQPRLLVSKPAASSVGMSTGRTADEPEESRDLVRVNDRPIPRQEARILFGYDTLFSFGAAALPILLAAGVRRREWLLVGLIGIVAVALCNVTVLGKLLNVALPMPLLWRARWMLPSLICVAAVAALLWEALCALLSRRSGGPGTLVATLGSVAAVAAFGTMLSRTDSKLLKVGDPPATLTKFSTDMHGLVTLLGGPQAAAMVWGPRDVTRELPQLMPHVKLVLSREKIMLRANHPQYRNLVLNIREKFHREMVTRADIEKLLTLYPIEHMVIDQPYKHLHPATRILREMGWEETGASGRYRVWRRSREPE